MHVARRTLAVLSAGIFVCAVLSCAQDSESLGDAARQARLQKQKTKDGVAKSASAKNVSTKPSRIITNDEIPEHAVPVRPSTNLQPDSEPEHASAGGKASADSWKSRILAQKNAIASLQNQISQLSASIQYTGNNCVSGCAQWNERQKQKQDQVETMKAQLEQQQKSLEDMQETARQQGYGSSVYDP